MDIGIYTTDDVLHHKRRDGFVFWSLSQRTKAEKDDKLFFATDGRWQGYFLIDRAWSDQIDFHSESWHELKEKPERKPFQEFTYKVPEA